MNLIYVLHALWVLLTGVETSLTPKKDLHKKKTFTEKLNDTFEKYFPLLCGVAIIFCLLVFVLVCFWICGVSAVESGNYYNHFRGVI